LGPTGGGPPLYEKFSMAAAESRKVLACAGGSDILRVDARILEAGQDDATNIGGARPYEPGPAGNDRNRIIIIYLGRSGLWELVPDLTCYFCGENSGGEWPSNNGHNDDRATSRGHYGSSA
jgi:hypothetical protein